MTLTYFDLFCFGCLVLYWMFISFVQFPPDRCVDEVNCHALGIAVNVTDEDRLGSTKDECCW